MEMSLDYRREIDGLRAIAVVPVLLFHAGFTAFSGGFVGVDVFFVISGYLITSIILHELKDGSFSIVGFYERRARRILPALLLVVAACIPVAWVLMLPAEHRDFLRSVFAVAIFASNFLFWRETGYFDTAAEFKPLLHTWSLAVEEQYYLIFPLAIAALWRWRRSAILPAMAGVALASFALAVWLTPIDPGSAFFLLPTRFWELLVGALVAHYMFQRQLSGGADALGGPLAAEVAGLAGLAAIGYATVAFDQATPFPGANALIPTFGAALIILGTGPQTLAGRLLGSRLLVGIGLISYSTYLWHQPLFAFARIKATDEPGHLVLAGLILLSFALAYATWRLVERPFRDRRRMGRRQIFAWASAGTIACAAVGLAGHFQRGYPGRFSPDDRALLASAERSYRETMGVFGLRRCFLDVDQAPGTLSENKCSGEMGRPAPVIVFGDSHAAHVVAGVKAYFEPKGMVVGQWTAAGCRAIDMARKSHRCRQVHRAFVDGVLPGLPQGSLIVLATDWLSASKQGGEGPFRAGLVDLLATLQRHRLQALVIGQTPFFAKHPVGAMVRGGAKPGETIYLRAADFRAVNRILAQEASRFGFVFADPSEVMCRRDAPLSCLASEGGKFLYFDAYHLSLEGSRSKIAELLKIRLHEAERVEPRRPVAAPGRPAPDTAGP